MYPTVQALADSFRAKETASRQQLKPFLFVAETEADHPHFNKKLAKAAKFHVPEEDRDRRLAHSESLDHQNRIHKEVDSSAATLWANTITTLPSDQFKFAVNAAPDTLPHNSNLYL